MKWLKMLAQQDSGAVAVEYGLLAAFLIVGCLSAYRNLGTTVLDLWDGVAQQLLSITSG